MKFLCVWLLAWLVAFAAAAAPPTDDAVRQLWQLLDYVAVDYGGAVSNGTVVKESEYAEMHEFAQAAFEQLSGLPAVVSKDALLAQACWRQPKVGSSQIWSGAHMPKPESCAAR